MKTKKQLEKDLQLLRRISSRVFDMDYRVFMETERKIENILEWAKISKDKRKPAVINWTSSPQRKVGYLIESLEFEIKKLKELNNNPKDKVKPKAVGNPECSVPEDKIKWNKKDNLLKDFWSKDGEELKGNGK